MTLPFAHHAKAWSLLLAALLPACGPEKASESARSAAGAEEPAADPEQNVASRQAPTEKPPFPWGAYEGCGYPPYVDTGKDVPFATMTSTAVPFDAQGKIGILPVTLHLKAELKVEYFANRLVTTTSIDLQTAGPTIKALLATLGAYAPPWVGTGTIDLPSADELTIINKAYGWTMPACDFLPASRSTVGSAFGVVTATFTPGTPGLLNPLRGLAPLQAQLPQGTSFAAVPTTFVATPVVGVAKTVDAEVAVKLAAEVPAAEELAALGITADPSLYFSYALTRTASVKTAETDKFAATLRDVFDVATGSWQGLVMRQELAEGLDPVIVGFPTPQLVP